MLIDTLDSNNDLKPGLLRKRKVILEELRSLEDDIQNKKNEYEAWMKEIQRKKKPLEEALLHIEALIGIEDGVSVAEGEEGIIDNKDVEATTTISPTDAAFNLLKKLHKPMHYRDIASALHKRNVYIPGSNPPATLLTRLSRDNRFKRTTKRGIYILSTWRIKGVRTKPTKKKRRGRRK